MEQFFLQFDERTSFEACSRSWTNSFTRGLIKKNNNSTLTNNGQHGTWTGNVCEIVRCKPMECSFVFKIKSSRYVSRWRKNMTPREIFQRKTKEILQRPIWTAREKWQNERLIAHFRNGAFQILPETSQKRNNTQYRDFLLPNDTKINNSPLYCAPSSPLSFHFSACLVTDSDSGESVSSTVLAVPPCTSRSRASGRWSIITAPHASTCVKIAGSRHLGCERDDFGRLRCRFPRVIRSNVSCTNTSADAHASCSL